MTFIPAGCWLQKEALSETGAHRHIRKLLELYTKDGVDAMHPVWLLATEESAVRDWRPVQNVVVERCQAIMTVGPRKD